MVVVDGSWHPSGNHGCCRAHPFRSATVVADLYERRQCRYHRLCRCHRHCHDPDSPRSCGHSCDLPGCPRAEASPTRSTSCTPPVYAPLIPLLLARTTTPLRTKATGDESPRAARGTRRVCGRSTPLRSLRSARPARAHRVGAHRSPAAAAH